VKPESKGFRVKLEFKVLRETQEPKEKLE